MSGVSWEEVIKTATIERSLTKAQKKVEAKKRANKKKAARSTERYWSDPEYRAKRIEKTRALRARKKAEGLSK